MAAVWLAVVAAVYSVVANAAYIFTGVRTIAKAGGAIAHLGFALMLLGILISSSKKEILSYYTGGIPAYFGKDSKENPGENVTLVKGLKTDMGKYWVTYERDSTHPLKPLWYYHLNFESKDGKDNFYLSPNAFVNYKGNMGLMANPDARHYLTYDVFTYITSLPDPDKRKDTAQFRPVELSVGDTLFYSKGFGILEGLQTIKNIPGIEFGPEDSATVATISIKAQTTSNYTIKPLLINKGGAIYAEPDSLVQENLVLQLRKVDGNKAELGIKESDSLMQYVTLKAYKFPYINVLWAGTIIMVIGFFISSWRRMSMNRKVAGRKPGPVGSEKIEEELIANG